MLNAKITIHFKENTNIYVSKPYVRNDDARPWAKLKEWWWNHEIIECKFLLGK